MPGKIARPMIWWNELKCPPCYVQTCQPDSIIHSEISKAEIRSESEIILTEIDSHMPIKHPSTIAPPATLCTIQCILNEFGMPLRIARIPPEGDMKLTVSKNPWMETRPKVLCLWCFSLCFLGSFIVMRWVETCAITGSSGCFS